jgi:hypothetical protein
MSYRTQITNLTKFNNIEDLYLYIDENSDELIYDLNLTNLLVDYRQFTKSVHEKYLVQRELECHSFFGNGDINRSFQFYNNYEETDCNDTVTDEYEYLMNRIQNSTNTILLGRYNHLIWKLDKKIQKRDFALKAINYYFKSIYRLYESHKIDKKEHFLSGIKNLYSLQYYYTILK